MKDGYIRVAAATPKIKVADPVYNRKAIVELMEERAREQVKLMVFPELCLTGYTCQDLFLQFALIRKAKEELEEIVRASEKLDMLVFVGLPWEQEGKLFNVAAAVNTEAVSSFFAVGDWKHKKTVPRNRRCFRKTKKR